MPETTKWNIYAEMETEVLAIWQLVQDTLASFNLAEPVEEEAEAV